MWTTFHKIPSLATLVTNRPALRVALNARPHSRHHSYWGTNLARAHNAQMYDHPSLPRTLALMQTSASCSVPQLHHIEPSEALYLSSLEKTARVQTAHTFAAAFTAMSYPHFALQWRHPYRMLYTVLHSTPAIPDL